jgi:hypothetical protein
VSFIVLDDMGFGHLDCFGSTIDTPNLDALAATACATTTCRRRRCVHRAGRASSRAATTTAPPMACVTEFATGFSGYDGNVPFEHGFQRAQISPPPGVAECG